MSSDSFSPLAGAGTTVTAGTGSPTALPGRQGTVELSGNAPVSYRRPDKVRIVCRGGIARIRLGGAAVTVAAGDLEMVDGGTEIFSLGDFTHIAHALVSVTPLLNIQLGWGD
jgi:hypothetical protein